MYLLKNFPCLIPQMPNIPNLTFYTTFVLTTFVKYIIFTNFFILRCWKLAKTWKCQSYWPQMDKQNESEVYFATILNSHFQIPRKYPSKINIHNKRTNPRFLWHFSQWKNLTDTKWELMWNALVSFQHYSGGKKK